MTDSIGLMVPRTLVMWVTATNPRPVMFQSRQEKAPGHQTGITIKVVCGTDGFVAMAKLAWCSCAGDSRHRRPATNERKKKPEAMMLMDQLHSGECDSITSNTVRALLPTARWIQTAGYLLWRADIVHAR